MAEVSPTAGNAGSQPESKPRAGRIARFILIAALLVTIGFAVNSLLGLRTAESNQAQSEKQLVLSTGLIDPTNKGLIAPYMDTQNRLLADPAPADQLVDPPVLVLSHIAGDPESPGTSWPQLEAQLASTTGKKIVDEIYDNGSDQLGRIKAGKIQIVALHAADTPFLVNNCGFQPIAVLGDDSGANGNHLDIIVPKSSDIATTANLKGHTIQCTVPTSITGYRAAVVLLMSEENLRPNIDYYIAWSFKQKDSIQGIADTKFQAAAVSDDKLQSMQQSGKLKADSYKIIYKSAVIPRTTIGYFNNLKPDLAAKVRDAILKFRPAAGAITAAASNKPDESDNADAADSATLHFIAIDYKKDFDLVRQINDRFDPRLDVKTKSKAGAATQP